MITIKTLVAVVAIVGALATPATAAAPPKEIAKLKRQNATLKAQVKTLRAQIATLTNERDTARSDLSARMEELATANREIARLTADNTTLKAQLAPPPSGAVSMQNGKDGDRLRLTGARIDGEGNMLAQLEYVGGLSCPSYGPTLDVRVTFFGPSGAIIATGSDLVTNGTPGTRYPIHVYGARGAVRADAVLSIGSCF